MTGRKTVPPPPGPVTGAESIALLVLVGAALAWSFAGASFAGTLHPDEARLGRLLQGSENDWSDPSLLLHVARVVRLLIGPEGTLTAGRLVSGLLGAGSAALTWRLLRDTLPPRFALFGASLMVVCPLASLPAHYFAPDALLLFFGIASLLGLGRVLAQCDRRWVGFLGIVLGGALSSHYASVSLLLVFLLAPMVCAPRDPSRYWRDLRSVLAIGSGLFLLLNAALFVQPERLLSGPWGQLQRAWSGGHLHHDILAGWFSFHLRESLVPGVTLVVLCTAVVGFFLALRRWNTLAPTARVTLVYGALVYLVAELSPLKPHPAFPRYVLLTLPALCLGSALAMEGLAHNLRLRVAPWLPALAMAVVLAIPAMDSLRTIDALAADPRLRADDWSAQSDRHVVREPHSSAFAADVTSLTGFDVAAARRAGITHLAASSFVYETFARGSRLSDQKPYIYERHELYQALFTYPYEEFAPIVPGFWWSGPTIRMIDIRQPQPPGRP